MRLIALLSLLLTPSLALAAADPIRMEIEHSLRTQLLDVWFPKSLDREHGGFLCDFDHQWKPSGRQPKTVVYQSRQLWLASHAMLRYPDDTRYAEAARQGFAFSRDTLWDKDHGGWYWKLDRAGKPTDDWRDHKHAYGISFGIYACAAYHKATRDEAALKLAQDGFAWLETHAHDGEHLGYFEYFTRAGRPILDPGSDPLKKERDCIGTVLGRKSMNTHIHLLEAFAALYEVWPDELVRRRTEEVLLLIRDRVTAFPPGAMHQFFQLDWTPIPGDDSYGHDVETTYLLLEAAHAIKHDDAKTAAVAKALIDHALDVAWDKQRGGFFEAGGVNGPVHDKRKVWWSQAEGLNTLYLMSKKFPDDPRNYRRLFEQQWAYVKANLIDAEHGEWHPEGLDTSKNPRASKASEWKAGYHTGRTLLNISAP